MSVWLLAVPTQPPTFLAACGKNDSGTGGISGLPDRAKPPILVRGWSHGVDQATSLTHAEPGHLSLNCQWLAISAPSPVARLRRAPAVGQPQACLAVTS
eukprot:6256207-Amphidinium_carterae.1